MVLGMLPTEQNMASETKLHLCLLFIAGIHTYENGITIVPTNFLQRGKTLDYCTCVVQRVPPGGCIPFHRDGCGSRDLAFILYLSTSSDERDDGFDGELCLLNVFDGNKQERVYIRPVLGRIVGWTLSPTDRGPLHGVTRVHRKSKVARLAMVGFFTYK
jgi:hypothetical protein